MAKSNPNIPTVNIITMNPENSLVTHGVCKGTPPAGALYAGIFALECIMQDEDGIGIYEQTGTVAVPAWTLIGLGTGGGSNPSVSPVYSLGSADNFAILAGTALTFTNAGTTVSAGNVGATTPTGTATTYGSGSYTGTGAPYAQAVLDVATLKASLIALTGTAITTPTTLETDNHTGNGTGIFAPGIYTSAAAIGVTAGATITLDGAGDYVFLAKSGAITFGANVKIVLINGATAARVFWVASTDLSTTGANSSLVGNFLVRDATGASTVTLTGRILASRAVTVDGTATTLTIPGGTQPKVTIANLATGITPSHVVKFAGTLTWAGSGATKALTVTGVLDTDIILATVKVAATETGYLASVIATADTLTFTLSTANTTNDARIYYEVLRAVA